MSKDKKTDTGLDDFLTQVQGDEVITFTCPAKDPKLVTLEPF